MTRLTEPTRSTRAQIREQEKVHAQLGAYIDRTTRRQRSEAMRRYVRKVRKQRGER